MLLCLQATAKVAASAAMADDLDIAAADGVSRKGVCEAVRTIPTRRRVLLSGYVLQNNLAELYSLLQAPPCAHVLQRLQVARPGVDIFGGPAMFLVRLQLACLLKCLLAWLLSGTSCNQSKPCNPAQ